MNQDLGYVSTAYVHLLYTYLEDRGVNAEAVLGEARPALDDGGIGRYSMQRWCELLEIAARELGDSELGLHLGQTITPAHIGVLGYLVLACANLGEAFLRLQRFYRLVYDAEPMQVRETPGEVILEWGLHYGKPGQLVDACAITALVQFTRDITDGVATPSRVAFVNPSPGRRELYRDYFACEVEFDQPHTMVKYPLRCLAAPLRQADPALLGILEQQASNLLAQLPDMDDFEEQVRRVALRLARHRAPTIEAVAVEMHTSVRTLQRRLSERGQNFQSLLDDTRQHMAREYLADRRLHLAEVAQLLGYSEQSAFNRAFRRWTGETPRAWRVRHAVPE